MFFTALVPAQTARRLGSALLREAMAVRGRMDLTSYDRLFPAQDVLPPGGVGNLITAPLHGKARHDGAIVFLDLDRTKTGNHSWRVRYRRPDGTYATIGHFTDAKAARDYAHDLETDRRRGTWIDPAASKTILAAWVAE